jgi:WD40 repeat protein
MCEIRGGGVVSIKDVDVSDRVDDRGPPDEMQYDVFLSYNGDDRAVVRNVARRLREWDLRVWFDKESSTPGADWQEELSARLLDSRACAVFVGAHEIRGWADLEMKVAVDRGTSDHDFQVFAVLLPEAGAVFDASRLPRFLATRQWVDLREGPESAGAIQELVNAVYGVARQAAVTVVDAGECPYRGLEAFEEEHARFFFGRTAQVQRLLEDLRRSRFLAVIGQSGVGKSSLVRAGLLPELRSGALPGSANWRIVITRPGAHPTTSLATAVVALHGDGMHDTVDRLADDERTLHLAAALAMAREPAGTKLLVLVDQFEEVFTLCTDPAERAAFVHNVMYAATIPRGDTVVVVTMRADFYPQIAQFPEFAQLVQSHHMLVSPMVDDALREIIQEPAYKAGLQIEQGLTDTILAEVERKPGNLPLLQHALLETWHNKRGTMLTLEGYRATGGVQHGLGERAEAVYEALSDTEKAEAKKLFLRLIQPGEGTEDTRRRVALSELATDAEIVVSDVIGRFVDARLLTITTDATTQERWIEISHEAVITGWGRCARWVDEDRAGLIIHRRLTVAAQEWKRLDRSPDALYRGIPLAEATAWRARAGDRMNWLERDFLDAGNALDRSTRHARRRRLTTAFVAMFTALAVIGGIAVVAYEQRGLAISRQLAAEANSVLNVDPALSLTLALRALDVAHTELADQVLRQATATSHGRSVVPVPGGAVHAVRLLPDGRVATGSVDGVVRVQWPTGAGPADEIARHPGGVNAVRAGPDGQSVASGGVDRTVRLTHLITGQSQVLLTAPATVINIEFSHRGNLLAAALGDGTVHVIDLPLGSTTTVLPTGAGAAYAASFSSDDSMLATANVDGTVQIFTMPDATPRQVLPRFGAINDVHFSPSAPQLAVAGADGRLRVWDVDTGGLAEDLGVSGAPLWFARFSPGGEQIATGGRDSGIHLLTTEGLEEVTLRGHAGGVLEADFDRTGTTLVSAGIDGTIRTWAGEDDVHLPGPVTAAAFDRDAARIVSGGTDGRLRLWRRSDLASLLDIPDHSGYSNAVFSTDGSRIVSFGDDGVVTIRNSVTGEGVASFEPGVGKVRTALPDPDDRRLAVGGQNGRLVIVDNNGGVLEKLQESGSPVYVARFSPDGRSVLAGRADGSITLWGPDRRPVAIRPIDHKPVYDVTFSPDGSLLASVDSSGSVSVWNTLGRNITLLRGHDGPASTVRFRGDGEQLFSSGADGTVRVWDVRTRRLLMTFEEGDGSVASVDISPNGDTVLQSADNGQARLLSCGVCGPMESVVALARSRAFRALTPEEEQRFSPSD